MSRLNNKVAIVTGAATGIGEASATALAQAGASVVFADIDEDAGRAKVEALAASGLDVAFQRADVRVTGDVEALIAATVKRFGRLDILVNNAAVAIAGKVAEISEEDWNQVLNTNLTSVWRGMHFAIPHMLEQGGGSIINMSSAQALMGFSAWSAYAAAKGGINALVRQTAVDYSPHNIRVNAIAPGTINTPMNMRIAEEADDGEALMAEWASRHAAGRIGEPAEVAALVVFLAGDDAAFITGEVIRVDGGLVINGG